MINTLSPSDLLLTHRMCLFLSCHPGTDTDSNRPVCIPLGGASASCPAVDVVIWCPVDKLEGMGMLKISATSLPSSMIPDLVDTRKLLTTMQRIIVSLWLKFYQRQQFRIILIGWFSRRVLSNKAYYLKLIVFLIILDKALRIREKIRAIPPSPLNTW